jgi:sensor histidine kinase YesM
MSFHVECDPELKEQFIPPLMLISLVENAVKHGIELKKGAVHIDVIAEQRDINGEHKLVLSVIDNGLGLAGVTSGTGIGLANIRERLLQLYGEEAALSLVERDEGGVCASITMPLHFQSVISH